MHSAAGRVQQVLRSADGRCLFSRFASLAGCPRSRGDDAPVGPVPTAHRSVLALAVSFATQRVAALTDASVAAAEMGFGGALANEARAVAVAQGRPAAATGAHLEVRVLDDRKRAGKILSSGCFAGSAALRAAIDLDAVPRQEAAAGPIPQFMTSSSRATSVVARLAHARTVALAARAAQADAAMRTLAALKGHSAAASDAERRTAQRAERRAKRSAAALSAAAVALSWTHASPPAMNKRAKRSAESPQQQAKEEQGRTPLLLRAPPSSPQTQLPAGPPPAAPAVPVPPAVLGGSRAAVFRRRAKLRFASAMCVSRWVQLQSALAFAEAQLVQAEGALATARRHAERSLDCLWADLLYAAYSDGDVGGLTDPATVIRWAVAEAWVVVDSFVGDSDSSEEHEREEHEREFREAEWQENWRFFWQEDAEDDDN